ncbi:AI-2E family transporter [Gordonia sp. NB41Y]|uniref:AI-2E family transporter n=1 Tax=Gordonia sp. NB41Y TaxID=875808 RepID=UPI0006C0A6DE|nr:AI-2E family transporter [Gordonia sp. NB41Y]KOY49040.1 permease [Gordonia sp. NB41Y]WLP90005.1 AI-2E family transporter [Gordonia sp. NB41Y]
MARSRKTPAPTVVREDPPDWSMPRGTIVLVTLAGLVVAVAGIKSVSSIVAPVFLALMLTVAVSPVAGWLHKKGAPTWVAFLTTLLLVYGILIGLFASLVYSAARLATILPTYSDKFNDLVHDFQNFLTSHGVSHDKVQDMLSHVDSSKVIGVVSDVLQSTLGVTSALILILAILLFMAADSVAFGDRMDILRAERPDVAAAFTSFAQATRSYLWVSTLFGLIVAVFDSVALWIIGIPLPILWGLLSFITNYIPNIGFVIGVIPPALLGLLDGGVGQMLLVIVIYSVINVIIQSVIQPKFVGDAVGLSTTLTFISLIFWAWVLGGLGAILAVPLTIMCKALLIDIDPSTRWADVLLTSSTPKRDAPTTDDSEAPGPEDGGSGTGGSSVATESTPPPGPDDGPDTTPDAGPPPTPDGPTGPDTPTEK